MTDQPDRPHGQAERKVGDERTVPSSSSSGVAGRPAPSGGADPTVAIAETGRPSQPRESHPLPPSSRYTAGDATVILGPAASHMQQPTVVVSLPPGRPRLVVTDATGATREHPITEREITIGRATDCSIVLSAPTVSRLHARITREAGECVLVPLGAQRNTYVDRELVTQPRLLRDGDTIRLATEQLVYRVAEDTAWGHLTRRRLTRVLFAGAALLGIAVLAYSVRDWRQPVGQGVVPAADRASPSENDTAVDTGAVGLTTDGAAPDAAASKPSEGGEEGLADRAEQALARERETLVAKLVYEGDIAFLERRYTTPPDGSAAYAYREALNLDPTNERALEQTAKIIDDYLRWADAALTAGNLVRARIFVEKAEYVHEQIPMAGDAETITARVTALRRGLRLD